MTPSIEEHHSRKEGEEDPYESDRESFPASDAPSGWAGPDAHDNERAPEEERVSGDEGHNT